MNINNKRLLRIGRRLTKLLLVIMLVLFLILTITWQVFKSDHQYVIQEIQRTALEKWQVDIELDGYELEWIKPFPFMNIQLKGLSLASAQHSKHPFLKINEARSQLNVWDLQSTDIEWYPLHFDSVWIHLHNDTLNNSNLRFKKSKTGTTQVANDWNIDWSKLPPVTINYLDVHKQNEYKKKWQWAKLSQVIIEAKQDEDQKWYTHLWSDCYFEGLVFNKKGRGFLSEVPATLDLNIAYDNARQAIILKPSSLFVDQHQFMLAGQYKRERPGHLQLEITNKGITMDALLPLLSDKVNFALRHLKIDQVIRAKFSLDEVLIPGKKGAILVDFETEDAEIQFKKARMTAAKLSGTYSNDCDKDGVGHHSTSCVTIRQLDGDISGVLPTQLKGYIKNLKDPILEASGKIRMDLPRLNALLEPKDKFTFTAGAALVNLQYKGPLMKILDAPFGEQNIRFAGDAVFDRITLETNIPNAPTPSLTGFLSFDETETRLDDIQLKWMGANILIQGKLSNLPEFLFYDDQALESNIRLHFDQLDLNNFRDTIASDNTTTSNPEIDFLRLERLSKRLARNLNGAVDLSIDRFHYDTLFLQDLKTQFRLFSPRYAEFVDSSMIRMNQLTANFMGQAPFSLDVNLSRDSITKLLVDVELPKMAYPLRFFFADFATFVNGDAGLSVSGQIPLRSLRQSETWFSEVQYQGTIDFEQTNVALQAFNWPVKDLSGYLNFDKNQLYFDSLNFNYKGSAFVLNGVVNNYPTIKKAPQEKADIDLMLHGNWLDLRNNEVSEQGVKREVEEELVSPAQLFRDLDTIFQYAEGKVDLQLDSVLTMNHVINPFVLQAQLVADDLDNEKHQLQVDSFSFGFGKDNHVRGMALIKKPDDPQVSASLEARMNFTQLGKFLPSEYIKMKEGYFKMDLDYQAALQDTFNAENYLLEADLNGTAELVNGKIFYNYRDFEFDNIYGHFRFDQKALYIRDLDLKVNGNRLIADGQSDDFFPFFILPDRRAHIDLNVASPRFDFGGFTAPHGLGKDSLLMADTTVSMLAKTGSFIDQLLNQGSINMSTDFKELTYKAFIANNLTGNISLQTDTVQLQNIQMEIADGLFNIDGAISDVAFHQPKMELAVQLKQNDIREVFRQFEDFGQDKLGYKNLEGKASATINFKAAINSNYVILPETMHGDMSVKLSGGQLINVSAIKKVTGFLSRKRKLDHILIDTLETFTHIRGSDLYIDQFYLHSSSFDFGAQGVYSLGGNENTRLLFGVPISNLFRRNLTQKELDSGNSKRKGMRVFIEARPKKNRMRFFWKIPFSRKKYRLQETPIPAPAKKKKG